MLCVNEQQLMKPYQKIPILECGEPLVPIPLEQFAIESPHPYEKLGASYGISQLAGDRVAQSAQAMATLIIDVLWLFPADKLIRSYTAGKLRIKS